VRAQRKEEKKVVQKIHFLVLLRGIEKKKRRKRNQK